MIGIVRDGHLFRAWGSQRDITGRKDDRVRAPRERAALPGAGDGEQLAGLDQRCRGAVRRAARIPGSSYTGQPWAEHRDLGWTNALHPDDRERSGAPGSAGSGSRDRCTRTTRGSGRWTKNDYRHVVGRAVPVLVATGRSASGSGPSPTSRTAGSPRTGCAAPSGWRRWAGSPAGSRTRPTTRCR